ncbi:hypothetical protein E3T55_09000 [Cryobacterium frigoriphilum]|uniref:Uncharacterized protein n=1 Tax=Cryobacterium frigoriphilum TaxID=1259150 RepID=A0A4R9A1U5_9MICO|nr:hypothetical protein [Cryobacterium frigoriphilum]TFD50544.1 hypothetical protein E3T55_09000 [Cryobacterium frigoriphilum]
MVAQLLRLKVRLLGNAFRRSPWQIVGVLVGLAYGLAIAAVLVTVLVGARFVDDVTLIRDACTVGGALVVLGFFVMPLLVGIDDTMDPRNFALFGVPTRSLAGGLLVSSFLGVPAIVLGLALLATVITWSRGIPETLLALIAAGALFVTCMLATRVSTSLASLLLSTRRSREFTGAAGVLVLIICAPIGVLLLNVEWSRYGLDLVGGLAAILGWTPMGAAWAVPGDAATGEWATALLKLLVALATAGLLWLAWVALVARMLVTPGREAAARQYGGLSWFDRLPHTPAGAIAARSITSWGRDSRYWVSLIMIPVVPVLVYIPLTIAGVPEHYLTLLPVPLMCLFLGWTIHNDVAYDSTAIWLHVASGTRGVADRIGRLVPTLVVGIPLIGLGSALSVFFYGDWGPLPAMLGVSTSIFLTGLGFSSYTSARFPYPATKPGDSPFAQPQASDTASAIVQSLTFTGAIVLSSPALLGLLLGIFVDPYWFMPALYYGVAMGLFVLVVGVWRGARAFERRGPEILASALRA